MSSSSASADRIVLKIIVLGASNVGKTSMMKRYVTDIFSGTRRATVGADFMTKKVKIEDYDVMLQLWDTAGQEKFHQGTCYHSLVHLLQVLMMQMKLFLPQAASEVLFIESQMAVYLYMM